MRTKRANIMMLRPKEQDRRSAPLEGSELFLGTPEEESRRIARRIEEKRILRGATIFREGDPSDTLFALKEGLVKTRLPIAKGSGNDSLHPPADRHLRGTPPLRGDAGLHRPCRHGCRGHRPSDGNPGGVAGLHPHHIEELHPAALEAAGKVEKEFGDFGHTWSYDRLSKVLLQLCEEHGRETSTGTMIPLRPTHEDLANLIGTTRETVTTQMIRFRRMGLVKTQDRFLVVNKPRLKEFGRP